MLRGNWRAEQAVRWATLACAVALAGCEQLRLPAIDPTGERVFLSQPATVRLADPSQSRCRTGGLFPKPAWEQGVTPPPCPEPAPAAPPGVTAAGAPKRTLQPRPLPTGIPGTLSVTPARMIAPVGSEVILVAGLCSQDGRYVMRQPIEWMLSRDSVGQIVDFSNRDSYWTKSKKLSADYAITRTAHRSEAVTRGTPSVTDDVIQQKGQCWVSLTSASEGTSYVTVVAPEGATWPQRRQTATIYWVDAQWVLPNPASVRAGQSHILTTSLTRTGTAAPVVGWIIRYELAGGAAARFLPGAAEAVEVRTDESGRATVQLQPTTPSPGTSQVRIQIIRPPDPQGDSPRTKIGEGYTSITWSAPGLALQARGPAVATVDATLVYRLEVSNTGDVPTRGVVVRDFLPPNLKFVSSNPPAQVFGDRAEWQLGDLIAKSTQTIEINARAIAGGSFRYRFQATSAGGLTADAAVDTQVTRPSLSLNVTGPQTALVGQKVEFLVDVTNTGDQPLDGVTVTDRFATGMEQAEGQASPIQQTLGRLEPRETKRIPLDFVIRRAGQLCHTVQAVATGGQSAQQQVCITATAPAVAPQPAIRARKTGPADARVGDQVQFSTEVTNTGNVPLTNVRIADSYDPELDPKQSSAGWDPAALAQGQLVWVLPQLDPGETVRRDVLCLCAQVAEAAASRVTVTANENVSDAAQTTIRISPASPPPGGQQPPGQTGPPSPPSTAAGQMTVDISEFGDPVKVGEKTAYLITIKNDRQTSDKNVVLTIRFPDGLKFEKLSGPVAGRNLSADGQTVTVNPIREMRPGEKLNPFRVEAVGTQPGDHMLEVTVTSERSPQGVTAREKTTVFSQ